MEIFSTEEQQEEAIKRFLRENGVALAAGAIIGLSGLYGWNWYNQNQIDVAEATSDQYEQLLSGEDVLASSEVFLKDNADSNYAVLAAFVAAKEAVEADDLAKADEKLSWIITKVQNPELKATAVMRLARVQAAQQEFDKALATLEQAVPASLSAQVNEIKGDILLSKGDQALAREAYLAAVEAGGSENNPLLQVKLDDLAQ